MTRAREEAERRRENNGSYPYEELITYDMEVDAFVLGAKWQSEQPIEVTDEMVERGARALRDDKANRVDTYFVPEWVDTKHDDKLTYRATARFILEAVLCGAE